MPPPRSVRHDAERIWTAALAAVDPRRLVAAMPRGVIDPGGGRIAVVGAGKAAAGMAAGVGDLVRAAGVRPERISGVVSVPAGCARPVAGIDIRETRPAAENQPTAEVVAATAAMMLLLSELGPTDLAIALITGGGSALLEAPAEGVELADTIAVAGALSRAGADIAALNTVRRAVSRVKAGGLARACRAGRLLVLVLSDVLGDPLDVIASGPCMPTAADAAAARAVLDRFGIAPATAPRLFAALDRSPATSPSVADGPTWITPYGCHVSHRIVGHNATAVAAARAAAEDLGYAIEDTPTGAPATDSAEDVGRRLAGRGFALSRLARRDGRPRAWIEGGEATVRVPTDHGRGGRNQQTVLAALAAASPANSTAEVWPPGLVITSIGTDGEDGPTAAAGAVADAGVAAAASADPEAVPRSLARCDAYPLLARTGALIRTGPTGTNVADLRIVLACP